MSQTLPNYGIKTVDGTDNAKDAIDILFDANFTIINTQLKLNEDAVAGVLANENNRIIAEDTRVSEFNTLKAESEVATNNTINATTEANNAINDTIEATALANDATNTINITNNNLKVWEVFNPSKIYLPQNKVVYNKDSYVCILQTVEGMYPNPDADTINWVQIAKHGADGLSSIVNSSFTCTIVGSHAIHGLTMYPDSDLQVFYKGLMLSENVDYTKNVDGLSVDMSGFTLEIGDVVKFKLYQSYTEPSIQALIADAIVKKNDLNSSISLANTANTNLINTIAIADTITYATKGEINTANSNITINSNKIGVLSANGLSENSLAEAIKNDRTQLADKASQLKDFISLPHTPMPPKKGLKTCSAKIVHKLANDQFRIVQRTNKGYLAYTLDTLNGDASATSVGGNWDLVRLKKVQAIKHAYVWYMVNTPDSGTITQYIAGDKDTIQEQTIFGYTTPEIDINECFSGDGTGQGIKVFSIAPSSSATFNIEGSYNDDMNLLYYSTNGSSTSVSIKVNGVAVDTFDASAYKISSSVPNYATRSFKGIKAVSDTTKIPITLTNNDATKTFYFCCFNFFELKDWKYQFINKYKAIGAPKNFINAVGASDYAITDADINKWCGSFHGGEVREYGKCCWNTQFKNPNVPPPTTFSSITNDTFTILFNFVILQGTNINNKAKMASFFDFDTDGSMEMKFALTDNNIRTNDFYTALTCTSPNFTFTTYPYMAKAIGIGVDTPMDFVAGEITQYDGVNLLELTNRFSKFNQLNCNKGAFVRNNASYSKFYYGAMIGELVGNGIIINNLCWEKGLDFIVK